MGLLRLTHVRPEVTPATTVDEAVRTMAKAEIGAIAVKDGKKIVGIFTERDLLKRVFIPRLDPASTPVKEVMTTSIVGVLDSTSVADAAALMRSRRMRHLVIVDGNGDYLGMIAQRHLLYDLMNDLVHKVDDLTSYLMTDGPGG